MPANYRQSAAAASGVRNQWRGWGVRPLEPSITVPPWILVQQSQAQIPLFSTVALQYPSNPTSGNLLTVAVAVNSGITVSSVFGGAQGAFSKAASYSRGSGIDVELWYVKASSSGVTAPIVTLSGNSAASIVVAEYSNAAGIPSSPLDQSASATGVGNAVSTASLTLAATGELSIMVISQAAIVSQMTAHNGFKVETQFGNGASNISLYYLDQFPCTGIINPAGTLNTSATWVAAAASFEHS